MGTIRGHSLRLAVFDKSTPLSPPLRVGTHHFRRWGASRAANATRFPGAWVDASGQAAGSPRALGSTGLRRANM